MLPSENAVKNLSARDSQASKSATRFVRERHSVRAFRSDPVPRDVLEECFGLAQSAPSSYNVQPWQITVLEGAALGRVSNALQDAIDRGLESTVLPLPSAYESYRSEMGNAMYGKNGYDIPRHDKERIEAADRRNFNFFEAPLALIVAVDSALAPVDILATGMYLHTLCLLLAEQRLGHCYQVSVAGYPDILRQELGLNPDVQILCGVAIGYEDETEQINRLRTARDDWKMHVDFCNG
ncbi:hypothetical protein LTR84_003353 [Exophiala bonariae]|uniref:Nitroreductase domain-containing protein n=1 Tax=Exophiala bonariae TaxID=1690606 RepID=A0AAV9N721_9EURO|nr:hypothetical protein LTR84_003353 [Exophiala bonariae]